jgi:hypothetical protein
MVGVTPVVALGGYKSRIYATILPGYHLNRVEFRGVVLTFSP